MNRPVSLSSLLLLCLPVAGPLSADETPPADECAAVSARIDSLLADAWSKAGVEPAPAADDAMFLRRAYLDLTGRIPTAGEARAFLDDRREDKRTRLIDELLASPEHSAHLSNVWRDVMLPRDAGPSRAFTAWLESHFASGTPYDELVRELLTTSGTVGGQPALQFYSAVELRPEALAAGVSRMFLGVQIGCAQCHDHPFTTWTQRDFWGLAAFFARLDRSGGSGQVIDVDSGEVTLPQSSDVIAPQFPDGASPGDDSATRREQLADWVTSPQNPFFARAAANRVWMQLFGRGLVDPVDDLGEHNPASRPAVLDLLARDFADSGYDLRRLFRVAAGTKAYQLSSRGESAADGAGPLFNVMAVKSLSAEQLFDCVATATCRREPTPAGREQLARRRADFLEKFKAPTQRLTEFHGGIPQMLSMLNGDLIADATDPLKSDLLAALSDAPFLNGEQKLDAVFLAVLSRFPTPGERQHYSRHLYESRDPDAALGDVLWVLLNSSEFLLNH